MNCHQHVILKLEFEVINDEMHFMEWGEITLFIKRRLQTVEFVINLR